MRKFWMNLFFRFYEPRSFRSMKTKEVSKMFDVMAKHEDLKGFENFFRQCANAYQNKYLYTQEEHFKGSAYALITLAEKVKEHKPANKMKESARQEKIVGNKNRKVKY